MAKHKEMQKNIEKLRNILNRSPSRLTSLSEGEILMISQQLDEMIVKYYKTLLRDAAKLSIDSPA